MDITTSFCLRLQILPGVDLAETAEFLRLEIEDLQRILAAEIPLPLARRAAKRKRNLFSSD